MATDCNRETEKYRQHDPLIMELFCSQELAFDTSKAIATANSTINQRVFGRDTWAVILPIRVFHAEPSASGREAFRLL